MSTPTPLDPKASEEALFQAAGPLDKPARKLFLDWACAREPELRQRLEDRLFEDDASTVIRAQHLPEEDLFQAAILLPAAARPSFLAVACNADASLRQRLEALLAAHVQPETLLEPQANRRDGLDEFPSSAQGVADAPDEAVGQTLGRYKLLEKVGEGGCGVVYVAEQTEPLRRRVALKVIKLGMDTKQVIARFEAERQALAMMDHPNIARVLDAGSTETGRPYFVMELVRGIKITDYCDRNNLPTKDRLALFIKVCQAIQHAHQKGIIHRDIKPSNILVTLHDGVPVPKVIDFGIAKATEGRLTDATVYTQLHQFIGTPAYMSPEQAEMSGLDIDTRSDIYSLGVLLYELLAGSTPFDAKELMASGIDAMRKTIREKEPVRPSTRLATLKGEELTTTAKRRSSDAPKLIHLLRGDLDWIVMKCLEKDRTRRYETANGLAADLKRHLNNEPVAACPPSTVYRVQKAFRRNKLGFAAAAAVLAALLIGAAISSWQAFIARKALQAAEEARGSERQQRLAAQSAQKAAEAEQQRADKKAREAFESQQQARRLLYAADMNLAQQAFKLNNLGKARLLLERHRPQEGEEDFRGWEWRYLWKQTRSSALVTLTNRPARGFSLSFSPDGNRLAVGWADGKVDLWDIPGRLHVRTLVDRVSTHAAQVAFSPARNSLVASSGPDTVTLYELDSGRELIVWQAPDPGLWLVKDLSFSQDGSKVVVYAGSISVYEAGARPELGDAVWVVNLPSGKMQGRYPTAYSQTLHHGAARLSTDNERLYLAHSDSEKHHYTIRCVELRTGRLIWETEQQQDLGLSALAVSPDGKVLASGSGWDDPAIRIWDSSTGRLLLRLEGHSAWVCKLAFSRDGGHLFSAASDQTVRVWDTRTWAESGVLRGHSDEVHSVAISEPAQLVATCGKDGNLMLWSANQSYKADVCRSLSEFSGNAKPLDQSRFLFLPAGHAPLLAELNSDMPSHPLAAIPSSADILACSGTNFLCFWDGTNHIRVCALQGEDLIQRGAILVESGKPRATATYDPTNEIVAWCPRTESHSIYLANLTGRARRIELKSDVADVVPLRFSPDGAYLAAAETEQVRLRNLRVWNIQTGHIVVSVNEQILEPVFAMGGRVLVVTVERGNDHELRFYDLTHPEQAPRIVAGRDRSWALAVSPNGMLVASSTSGGLVRLFDPANGELIESIRAHLNAASRMAFSVDGRRLASASGGQDALKLWDMTTRQELLTLSGGASAVASTRSSVQWSADGNVILIGPPWRVWCAPSWQEIAAAEAADPKPRQQP